MGATGTIVGQRAPLAPPRARRADTDSNTDAELIVESLDRPELFEEIYRRHHRVVCRHIERRTGPDTGADIAAEVFVSAFAARHRYRVEYASARPWLFGIAANLLRQHFRTRQRATRAHQRLTTTSLGYVPDTTEESSRRVDASLAAPDLAKSLAVLRAVEREVLLAYAIGDLSYVEIAEALGIPVGTVRSRLARARQRIRRRAEAGLLDPRNG